MSSLNDFDSVNKPTVWGEISFPISHLKNNCGFVNVGHLMVLGMGNNCMTFLHPYLFHLFASKDKITIKQVKWISSCIIFSFDALAHCQNNLLIYKLTSGSVHPSVYANSSLPSKLTKIPLAKFEKKSPPLLKSPTHKRAPPGKLK